VAAHRALQNLGIAEHRRGELLVRYRALLDGDPQRSEWLYLWGRLLTGSEAQREAFEAARRADPRSPWPWLGLGALELAAGRAPGAIASLRRARVLAPDLREVELLYVRALLADAGSSAELERLLAGALDAEPWDVARVLLVAEQRAAQDRPREAIEILGRLLARVPRNPEAARRLLGRLEREGTVEDAIWLERELEGCADEPSILPILARCHAMRGNAEAAIAAWNALPDLRAEERAWRRLLRIARGELGEAIAEEAPRFRALSRVGAQAPGWIEVAGLVAERGREARAEPVELASALSRMGWVEEAIALLRPGTRSAAASGAANRLLVRLFAQRQFEAELKSLALETYRAFAQGGDTPDFERFLARIGAAARRSLGDDLLSGTTTLSFWPVGRMIDPTAQEGLSGYFLRCGRLLVAGQRRGRPPELLLTSVIAHGSAGPRGAPVYFVEGTLVPGWLEHEGARFAGAALDRFLYVDVAAVEDDVSRILALERRLGAERERVLADPVLPAGDRRSRRSVSEPAEVATKLELRALDDWRDRDPGADAASLVAEAIDGVLAHEIGHLEDAARFLPLSSNLWRNLGELVRLGFSPRRVEAWLEMRAAGVALARARNPRLVLASCVGHRAEGATLTPHGGGYKELLDRLVALIDDSPEEFPALDRGGVLLQQLDRLTPDEIRSAARRVLADLGIDAGQPATALRSLRAAARSP